MDQLSQQERSQKRIRLTLKILKWTVIAGLFLGFLGGGIAFGYIASLVKDDPVRDQAFILNEIAQNNITGFVYFADDTIVGQIRADEDRRLIPLKNIPELIKNATFAIEDDRFYEHNGIDLTSLARAVKQKVLNEDVQTGGSTITQQLARRVFLNLEKSSTRKAKEIFLSMRLERLLSKDEILEAYLNKIPYGQSSSGYNMYGIAAAAKGLFNIEDLAQVNIAQAAYLAGLPQQPSNFSAFNSKGKFDSNKFKRAIQRQHLVLDRMLEEKFIDQVQYEQAKAFDIQASLAAPEEKAYNTYPFLMIEAENEAATILLKAEKGEEYALLSESEKAELISEKREELTRKGYRIFTTIDKAIYDAMHLVSSDPKNFGKDDPEQDKYEQIGAVMMDNRNGAILGMIEGRDFHIEQLNHATQAYRQPGSAMKPLVAFIPAMELGLIQPASILDDVPMILEDGTKGFHIPVNHDNKFHGLLTAREALNQSYNIPALKIFLDMVGIDQAWTFVKKMGITSIDPNDKYAQTGVIGGLTRGITVKEMTNAYATIPNQGTYVPSYMIRRIVDAEGRTVYAHAAVQSRVYSEQTAFLINDMLRTVIDNGTAGTVKSNFKFNGKVPIAGKTGTTSDNTDVWFIGYTPDVTLGVWIGYDKPAFKLSKANGGTSRAKVNWAKIMNEVLKAKTELTQTKKSYTPPANVTKMTVSKITGLLPNGNSNPKDLITDWFNQAHVPTMTEPEQQQVAVTFDRGAPVRATEATPADFVTMSSSATRQTDLAALFKKIEELMKKLPPEEQKPLNQYIPLDANKTIPTVTDKRIDDGLAPEAPDQVQANKTEKGFEIKFEMPIEPADLIGYRLYRMNISGEFEVMPKQIIYTGNERIFRIKAPKEVSYYAVTAVDVVGNESSLSVEVEIAP